MVSSKLGLALPVLILAKVDSIEVSVLSMRTEVSSRISFITVPSSLAEAKNTLLLKIAPALCNKLAQWAG